MIDDDNMGKFFALGKPELLHYRLTKSPETGDDDVVQPFGASKLLFQITSHEGHAGHVVAVKNNAVTAQGCLQQGAHKSQVVAVNHHTEF